MKVKITQENLNDLKRKEFIEFIVLNLINHILEVHGNPLDQDGNSIYIN